MRTLLLAILFVVAVTACGQKGPLRIDAPPPTAATADPDPDDAESEPRRRDR